VAGRSDAIASGGAERIGGARQIQPRDPDERPRPERRGDRVAGAADDEQISVADLLVVGAGGERRGRPAPDLRVAGEQRAVAIEHRRRAQIDRERGEPRQRARRRQRTARHRDRPGTAGPRGGAGTAAEREGRPAARARSAAVGRARDNARVTFIRIAWLATVLACVVTGVVLLVSGYQGYAAVFGAVGACAAINLR
jgi:hypothetical protein